MLTTPTIINREAISYAAVRRSVAMSELDSIVGPSFDIVVEFVRRSTDGEVGAPFIKYDYIDMDGLLQLELGVAITAPITATGEIVLGELPAGRYATVTHTGSYDELYDVTASLVGWAKERGIDWDSAAEGPGERFVARTETYLNDPDNVPAHELVTELHFKVRD